MPWTFAHPAAVLPLWALCPKRLNFTALVVGSITPDLGYYVGQFRVASFAHTLPGSLLVCIPSGLALLAVLFVLRKPLCFLLPQPHRQALAPLVAAPLCLTWSRIFTAAFSIVLGAWTHIVWDSFTHRGRWAVNQFALLREPLFRVGATDFPGYSLLQHLSTLVGVIALAGAYWLWLRRHRSSVSELLPQMTYNERWRWSLIAAAGVIALAIAVPFALGVAAEETGYHAFHVFVFHTAVYATAAFMPLFITSALIYYVLGREA